MQHTSCYICKSRRLEKFLDLGTQSPSDAFVREEDAGKAEASYPLALCLCEECGLVQLGFTVDPRELFTEYVYTTGMNNSLRENFTALVEELGTRFALGSTDFVVDIGSNDGTLLKNYGKFGSKVLGIDPSSVAEVAKKEGVPTLREFFNETTALSVLKTYGHARIITATNVFAHVPDLESFMRGIQALLSPDGVFVSESGYLLDMITTGGYDAVYHEHLRYYSLRPMFRLFSDFGFEIFDVRRIPSHSGSIRVSVGHKGAHLVSASVANLVAEEKKAGLEDLKTYTDFGERAHAHMKELQSLLLKLRHSGARIVGIGAPAKGNTLLNSCGITAQTVEALLEKSEYKIGLYAPGSHIPVKNESILFSEQPQYALMLSWNLSEELIPKLRAKEYRGAFIIPFPKIRIE